MREYRFLVNRASVKVKLPDLADETTFHAEVNGQPIVVELSEAISPGQPFFIQVGGKPYQVELSERSDQGLTTVKINGASYVVQLGNKNRKAVLMSAMPDLAVKRRLVKSPRSDKGAIVAAMPGKVVLVRVKTGDLVEAKDVLLVVESMKMENEIVSPTSGTVTEVRVSEGDSVSVGEVMLVIGEA